MSEIKRSWLLTDGSNDYFVAHVKNQLVFFQLVDEKRKMKLKANVTITSLKKIKALLCSEQHVVVCLENSLKIIDLINFELVNDIEVQGSVHSLLQLGTSAADETYMALVVNTKRSAVVYLLRNLSVTQEFQVDNLVANALVCNQR